MVRGQYIRSTSTNGSLGAGSQLASRSVPGESAWTYSVSEPSGLVFSPGSIGELIR